MKHSWLRWRIQIALSIAMLLGTPSGWVAAQPMPMEPLVQDLGGPFELKEDMRSWLRTTVHLTGDDLDELYRLDRAINGATGLTLVEVEDWSGGAREVFDRGEADCVGYAFLFLALADELGLDVGFAVEAKADRLEMRPGLQILRRHLAVVHSGSNTVWDFSGARPFEPKVHEAISRDTARAILDSNRGMQRLLAGDPSTAVGILRQAIRWDPNLAFVWTNLAVAIRQSEADVRSAESGEAPLLLDQLPRR